MSETFLSARNLSFAYDDSQPILDDVSLTVKKGELVGLVGANGSGKSTLLRLIVGLLPAAAGQISICGDDLTSLNRKEIAKRVALVPQDSAFEFAFSVREVVAMGRFPYLGRFDPETSADRDAVKAALNATQTDVLADRPVNRLSGGERQRVALARALAQDTPLLLLDEPTANQDVVHQLELLELVRARVDEGRAALAAIHDLMLAARFCDRIVILSGAKVAAEGAPDQAITPENLAKFFRIEAQVDRDPASGGMRIWPVAPIKPRSEKGLQHV